MRLKLRLRPLGAEAVLPVQYNSLIQGFIYRHVRGDLAETVHNRGIKDGKRSLRLFSFSRLLARGKVTGDLIRFTGAVELVVTSPIIDFLESLATNLVQSPMIHLGPTDWQLEAVEVESDPPYAPVTAVRTISPITVYSTVFTADGRRKTYYYSPFEAEFGQLLLRNLQRKARAWYGVPVELNGASIRPLRVRSGDQRVLVYKGTVIKAWMGLYELHLSEPLFRMAFDAGLGAKNSQGFGCIALCQRRNEQSLSGTGMGESDEACMPRDGSEV